MVFVFMGPKIFGLLGSPVPDWAAWMQNNKMSTVAAVMLLNSFAQAACQTGAFEIMYDGQLVYSKLETGKMPSIELILRGLQRAGLETSI